MDDMGPDMTGMSDDEDMVYEDLEVGQEADVSKLKDGGCMKKVLVKGTGDERPDRRRGHRPLHRHPPRRHQVRQQR